MELFRLLLNYKFYEGNKYKILSEMFPSSLHNLYNLILKTHEELHKDLSIQDVKALYRAEYPTAPIKHLEEIFRILDTIPEINNEVAQTVLEKSWVTEMGRQIVSIGTDIVNGKQASFEKAKQIILQIEKGELSTRDDIEAVSSELEDILAAVNTSTK